MKFDDLASVAKGADKKAVPTLIKNMFLMYFVWFPVLVLLMYPPIWGFSGWGVLGGIAGILASLTLTQAALEIKFLIKGV